jgi:hypothetical protein
MLDSFQGWNIMDTSTTQLEKKMKVLNYNTREILAVLSDDRKKALKELTKLSNSKNYLVHSVRSNFALVFVR